MTSTRILGCLVSVFIFSLSVPTYAAADKPVKITRYIDQKGTVTSLDKDGRSPKPINIADLPEPKNLKIFELENGLFRLDTPGGNIYLRRASIELAPGFSETTQPVICTIVRNQHNADQRTANGSRLLEQCEKQR